MNIITIKAIIALLEKSITMLKGLIKLDWARYHFVAKEFECQCGCGKTIDNIELLDVLEDIRFHFNKPITITSGYRCEKHNREVGGSINSKHMEGIACDFKVRDVKSKEVVSYLNLLYPNKYGIGIYSRNNSTDRTHLDIRPTKARWSN